MTMFTSSNQENDHMRFLTVTLAVAAAAACARTSDQSADSPPRRASAAADTGMPMTSMPARAVGSGAMVEQMRAHLRMMQALKADSLRAALSMHATMTDGMLAQMSKDMMDMKIPANRRWSALMDSVHQDLDAMRGMGGGALERAMAAHTARLTRLMAMHHAMLQPKRGP